MKHYIVYKITNKSDNKIYIGVHITKNLEDGYMGSGKYLQRAIKKQGLKNFTKEILYDFNNLEEMFAKEAELVNEDFINRKDTYNLKLGGFGGWDSARKNIRNRYKNDPIFRNYMLKCLRKAQRKATDTISKLFDKDPKFRKKVIDHLNDIRHDSHVAYAKLYKTDSTFCDKMNINLDTGRHKGPEYIRGTRWYTNDKISVRSKDCPVGFRLGRQTNR